MCLTCRPVFDRSNGQLYYLRCVVCLKLFSRLKVNIGESVIITIGNVSDVEELAAIFGCKM